MAYRKFIFLYLNTGAGHISAAKVLAEALKEKDPSVEIEMINGFDRNDYLGHFLLEIGYNFSCNYLHGAFPLAYDFGTYRWAQAIMLRILQYHTERYLEKLIRSEHPTDIVSFHFALSTFAKRAVDKTPDHINLTVMVTDPFTVPPVWFYDRELSYFVYSQQAKEEGVKRCRVPAKNITVVPFLMNKKYCTKQLDADEIRALRIKHGFDPDKKMVLLVGGGEGLPGASEIIQKCVIHKAQFAIAVVCGRDRAIHDALDILHTTYTRLDLHVYGFIDFLDELVKICDCVVIKAGPAMLMEVLESRKPVIISRYIHNQELGNMRFAVYNNVGYFIQRPGDIYRKINALLNDTLFDEKMKKNFDAVKIDTDSSKTAGLLLGKPAAEH
jgi:UDP-N-acetylglucosamine:LPS N-acetylglucosamine transferase